MHVPGWTHDLTPPPGGTGQLYLRIHALGDGVATAYCWSAPCGCETTPPKVYINGVHDTSFDRLGQGSCASISYTGKVWYGAEANALASAPLTVRVEWNKNWFALDYAEVFMYPAMEVAVHDGNGQRGVIGSPVARPIAVKVTSPDPSFSVAGATVTFEIVNAPSRATGHGLGADDQNIAATYTAAADSEGIARATLVLGGAEGSYSVRVKSERSLTGATADFTALAVKPASVTILKDAPDMAFNAGAYAVSATESTPFFLMGLNAAGEPIGPVKATWSLGGGGSPSTRGSATVPPGPSSKTTLSPLAVGKIALKANPAITGISSVSADLFITKLYVSVQNTFSASAPVDDSARFVPGMYLDGASVALDVMELAGQLISLHVPTGGAKGKATFTVDSTNYPGIAMNYPPNGDATEDMQFTNGSQSVTVDFDTSTGDTWVGLLVRDYGASGTVRISIQSGRTTYSLAPLTLPVDADNNNLPDAGWRLAPTGTVVATSGITAGGDIDDPISTSNTAVGDGISNYEEYRGFVSLGSHLRTNPRKKDVFLDVDPEILTEMNALPYFTPLPLSLHYLDPGEASGSAVPNRYERNRPIINVNRAGVPGARPAGKRAVRIVYQLNRPPVLQDPLTLQTYEAWRVGILGITIPDEFVNLYTLNATVNVEAIHSPDYVQVVELYPSGFNRALHTDFTGVYRDTAGNPVPDCTTAAGPPCDYYDYANNLILPYVETVPGLAARAFRLHTALELARYPFPDWYSKPDSLTCSGGVVPETTRGLSDDRMLTLRGAYSAHELGHALHMEHTSICGNIMYDNYPESPRRTMADVLPIFGTFTTLNLDQVVVTEP